MKKVERVYQLLLDTYGEPLPSPSDPLDTLVLTILSQNTNDTLRDRAFDSLRRQFPSWTQVRDAPVDAIVASIQSAGLASQKGPRIKAALQYISAQRGQLSLDFLATMPMEQARAWLLAIDGVGPKTAAIVLLFAFGRPAFPVDTHVHRVSTRLGLIPKTSAEKAHRLLEDLIPPAWYYSYHLNLIRHGRQVCVARNPKCKSCPLQACCDYFQTHYAEKSG